MCFALTDTHPHRLCDITGHPNTHSALCFLFLTVSSNMIDTETCEVSFVLSLGKTQMKTCNPVSTPHIIPEVYPFDCIIIARGNFFLLSANLMNNHACSE